MQFKEFYETFLNVDFIEDTGLYGHDPFNMVSVNNKGIQTISSLSLESSESYYQKVKDQLDQGAKTVFLSMDFPPIMDITTDWIAVFWVTEHNVELFGLPYDNKTGDKYKLFTRSEGLKAIESQLMNFLAM